MEFSRKKNLPFYLFAIILAYSFSSPYNIEESSRLTQDKKLEFQVNWKSANQNKNLKQKYAFLSDEYRRIANLWKKNIEQVIKGERISLDFSQLISLLEDELPKIRPYLVMAHGFNLRPKPSCV